MAKQKRRKRRSGWARTKDYPHKKHPAHYKRVGPGNDDIEYITFTHSKLVEIGGNEIETIPLSDNISPAEREKNKKENIPTEDNRSYAYPKVYKGKRSALKEEVNEFDPVTADKEMIADLYNILPKENVPMTGGKGKYKKVEKKESARKPKGSSGRSSRTKKKTNTEPNTFHKHNTTCNRKRSRRENENFNSERKK